MKKLILLFVVTIQTMVAMADVSGKCGDNLTWTYTESTQTLTIVGTGAITNFSSYIVVPWYSLRGVIKHVVIGDGVTSIGNYAFYDCGALVSVTIGNTVATIGYNAFFGCGALLKVYCYALEIPVLSVGAFSDIIKATLYVPSRIVAAYSAAMDWDFFASITSLSDDPSGIESVRDARLKTNTYYDLNGGKMIGTPTQKGMYIVNGKKVVIK
jgi:hypothetical protein